MSNCDCSKKIAALEAAVNTLIQRLSFVGYELSVKPESTTQQERCASCSHPARQCNKIDHNGDFGWLKCEAYGEEFQWAKLTPASQKKWDAETKGLKKR